MEIERKFLVTTLPDLNCAEKYEIIQSYVSITPEIRVRKKNEKYYLTEKSKGTLVRSEHERKITKEEFIKFRKDANGIEVEKTRYVLPLENGLFAEIDIYKGKLAPLIVVEVEFDNENDANNFTPPVWFGKELTEDLRYKNINLALSVANCK